jgi:hypothetical protein
VRNRVLWCCVLVAVVGVGMVLELLRFEPTLASAGTRTPGISPEALHLKLDVRALPETRVDSYN